MKVRKSLLFLCMIVILVGCGAVTKYKVTVEPESKEIVLAVEVEVAHDDYKYLTGGKESLLSIISSEMPLNYTFAQVDETSKDIYKFTVKYSTYAEYISTYEALSNKKSQNEAVVEPYSNKHPFHSYFNIKFKDNPDVFMSWLKDGIVKSGKLINTTESSLISSSSTSYSISGSNKQSFDTRIDIDQVQNIDAVVFEVTAKRDNRVDLSLAFKTTDQYTDFDENLNGFLKDKLKLVTFQHQSNGENHSIYIEDVDLLNPEMMSEVMSVYGSSFMTVDHKSNFESSFFFDEHYQSTIIKLNSDSLFNLEGTMPIKTEANYEGVERVLENSKNEKNSNDIFNSITLTSSYKSFKVVALALIVVAGISLIGLTVAIWLVIRKYPEESKALWKKAKEQAIRSFRWLKMKIVEGLNRLESKQQQNYNPIFSYDSSCLSVQGQLIHSKTITCTSMTRRGLVWSEIFESILVMLIALVFMQRGNMIAYGALLLGIIGLFKTIRERTLVVIMIETTCATRSFYSFTNDKVDGEYRRLVEHIKGEDYEIKHKTTKTV
ncbi:hypothetical protein [Erysipelothrix anatis]|uniref:hypothetical protein n=1 Tax=Erysipelothrix anatis TaxID=2683713 RepID=UPI00135C381B|nr:hypothetical protein [Erysipelothrix anatis]